MTHLLVQEIEKKFAQNFPVLRTGYTVKVSQKIKEGEKERVQIFQGLVIAINHGQGASKTITVRKEVEGIGVEKIFPLASANVVKIEIVRTAGVRRGKLYYMRKLQGKSARLKEKIGLTAKDAKYYGAKEAKLAKPLTEEEARIQAEQLKKEMVKNMEAETVEKDESNPEVTQAENVTGVEETPASPNTEDVTVKAEENTSIESSVETTKTEAADKKDEGAQQAMDI